MKNFSTFVILCLAAFTVVLSFKVHHLQSELAKAQPRIAMANMIIAAANSAPTNTGALICITRR